MATILIVDDHVLNRELLMMALEDDGHRLIEASDGLQALKLVLAERPDVVITDILMPRMDGYEFVTRLRGDPAIADTPVIFYTATYRESEAAVMAQACGVRWTLAKPSDPETIQATVREALGEAAPASEAATATTDSPAAVSGPALEENRFSGIEHQLAATARELTTSMEMLEQLMARGDDRNPEFGELARMVKRLSAATATLQATSLRLTALIEMGIELSGERDPARLVVSGCRLAQNLTVARFGVIGLFGPHAHGLEYFTSSGLDGPTEERLAANPDPRAGILGTLLEDRVACRKRGLPGDPTVLGLPADHPPLHSFLGTPIATRERTYGWLYVGEKLGAEEFSDLDERVIGMVADQLAVCYENLVLENEAQETHLRLARELSERIRQSEDLRRFRNALDVSDDAIFLFDLDSETIADVNLAACHLVSMNREQLLRTRIAEGENSEGEVPELLTVLADPEGPTVLETEDGKKRRSVLDVARKIWRSADGRLLAVIVRDMTARATEDSVRSPKRPGRKPAG